MKIIAIYNIKGGVGKTASAVNISAACAIDGNNTLLIDLDPQGASSYYFEADLDYIEKSEKVIKGKKSIEKSIKPTRIKNLDILPADTSFRKIDIILKELKGSNKWLKNFIKPVKKQYDYIFLDCPPSISLFSENIFANADIILVPIVPTTLCTRTYNQLIDFFKQEKLDRSKLLPFFSMTEKRKTLHRETIESFQNQFPETINVSIPYNSLIEKMGEYKMPIVIQYPYAETSFNYKKLWNKVKKEHN